MKIIDKVIASDTKKLTFLILNDIRSISCKGTLSQTVPFVPDFPKGVRNSK